MSPIRSDIRNMTLSDGQRKQLKKIAAFRGYTFDATVEWIAGFAIQGGHPLDGVIQAELEAERNKAVMAGMDRRCVELAGIVRDRISSLSKTAAASLLGVDRRTVEKYRRKHPLAIIQLKHPLPL